MATAVHASRLSAAPPGSAGTIRAPAAAVRSIKNAAAPTSRNSAEDRYTAPDARQVRRSRIMRMTYEEALEYINGANRFGKKLGLQNIRTLLGMMGDPQKPFIHVAGTNGKGSMSSFIEVSVGSRLQNRHLYPPYLQRFGERIAISGPAADSRDDHGSVTGSLTEQIRIYRQEISGEELLRSQRSSGTAPIRWQRRKPADNV